MFLKVFKAATAAIFCLASPALADWSANLITLGVNNPGAAGQVECAPNGSFHTVWGTGTYTSDSSICTAAVHFGWIAHDRGGVVGFQQVPGMSFYSGSSQNGVTTSDYGSWDSSFQITGARPLTGGIRRITWGDSADSLGVGGAVGQVFAFECPTNNNAGGTVWGTDVYTSDSSICGAATHRGLVTPSRGGTVTVRVLGPQAAYAGTMRNGVATSDYPSWPRSFIFNN
ncbi:LCCL domain-containing protein [Gymnodinialimonas ceratoperidinii]|uniref:LCCL domain-containing protein n=1 Tax=Gymnodinialimonas ceratoperidinii TaxID=2856823 RepID=A0A8F6Y9P8_9RHOB|nr:LCCL domain-containing protein [Gymnodinialimonas ceratoperidinii]QXT38106.1 hypothetical protein KYE46_09045 [Gymnodinialimonas ceratoperidinii]